MIAAPAVSAAPASPDAAARRLRARFGWCADFDGLPGPRGLPIVCPQTSNSSFLVALPGEWASGLPLRFVHEESLFRGFTGATLDRLSRFWGGRPVDREHSSRAVEPPAQRTQCEPAAPIRAVTRVHMPPRPLLALGLRPRARRLDPPVGLATIEYDRKRYRVRELMHAARGENRRPRPPARHLGGQAGLATGARRPDRLPPARRVAPRPPWCAPALCRGAATG